MNIADPPPEFSAHPDLTVVEFGPPVGYSSGEIHPARFLVDRINPRFPCVHTFWRPTHEEVDAFTVGAVAQFSIFTSTAPPPVSSGVYLPELVVPEDRP